MELYVLNKSLTPVAIIDAYTSLIWTKRYYTYGDFELVLPAESQYIEILQKDFYIRRTDDSSVMIVEKIQLNTDAENGDEIIVSGRSLESILMRRIFNRQFFVTHSGGLSALVNVLIYECTGGGRVAEAYRQIPNLSVDNTYSPQVEMSVQFTGDVLFDAIMSICKPLGIGLRMSITGQNMIVYLYSGTETSVVFSEEYDNLKNSQYTFDTMNLANHGYIAGEGEGKLRVWAAVIKRTTPENPSGLDLRELFIDAKDVSSNNGEISYYDYVQMLAQKGEEKLFEHGTVKTFEAEVEPSYTFEYKTDYNLGDIVTVENKYGIKARPRIVEIIESWSDTGYTVVPTFEQLEMNGESNLYAILRDKDKNVIRDVNGSIILVKKE